MRVVATSDLHGALPETPECDLLLIAGDVCPGPRRMSEQRRWLFREFGPWLAAQPAGEIVWIAGNHDFVCQQPGFDAVADRLPGTYLYDDSTLVHGRLVYGTPWISDLDGWAFCATDEEWIDIAAAIPGDTDILVTHAPPCGVLDRSDSPGRGGAPHLLARVEAVGPKLHVFGHIHGQGDVLYRPGSTQFANVAGRVLVFDL